MSAAVWTAQARRVCAIASCVLATQPATSGAQTAFVIGSPTAGLPASEYSSNSYEWTSRVPVVVREVAEADRPLHVTRLPPSTLHGIDEGRFGFASVSAWFERIPGAEEDRSELTSSATLHLWLQMRRADGRQRWWQLTQIGNVDGRADMFDPFWISDEPAQPESLKSDRLDFAAAARGAEPVIVVRFFARMFGANSGVGYYHHLLIDLRSGEPRVFGLFDDVEHSCGGACTYAMCVYTVREEVGCRWDSALNDFACASTLHRTDTAWITRRATRRFRFSDDTPLPAPPSDRAFADIDAAGAVLWGPATPGKVAVVDAVGSLTTVADTRVGSRRARLLGAPSMSWHFGARFFAALEDPSRGPLTEIGNRLDIRSRTYPEGGTLVERLESEPGGSSVPSARHIPDGPPPHFVASVVATDRTLTVLRVLVTEGAGKGVYLIGLELAGERLVTDAMLVATNGESHLDCNAWRVPATAVGMTVTAKPFAATLDVEPERIRAAGQSRQGDAFEPPRPDSCRRRSTVEWEAGHGFRPRAREERCGTTQPRRVSIDATGNIGVAPPAAMPPL